MNRLLLWSLLLVAGSGPLRAQVTQFPDRIIYRGADYSFDMVLSRADSALTSTATLFYDPSGSALPNAQQPLLTRTGRTLSFAWSAAQTTVMRDGKFWLEIKAGPSVRYAAWVIAGKTPTIITRPGTLTVVSPIADLPGTTLDRPYSLSNVGPSGHRINHNGATKLVTGTFFREDSKQVDPLWRINIVDENNVDVVGPPGETFSGYVVLKPIPISNQ